MVILKVILLLFSFLWLGMQKKRKVPEYRQDLHRYMPSESTANHQAVHRPWARPLGLDLIKLLQPNWRLHWLCWTAISLQCSAGSKPTQRHTDVIRRKTIPGFNWANGMTGKVAALPKTNNAYIFLQQVCCCFTKTGKWLLWAVTNTSSWSTIWT